MPNIIVYKGYRGTIEYNSEDEMFTGSVFGVRDSLNYHGRTVKEATASFHECVDEYLALCKQFGKEPDEESLNIRLASKSHQHATMEVKKKEYMMSNSRKIGREKKYILIEGRSTLTDEETEENDEIPNSLYAISCDFFERWICDAEITEKEFFNTYTGEDFDRLLGASILNNALAFEYRPEMDEQFVIQPSLTQDDVYALIDFIIGLLQENGHEDASKYLDALFEL